jgi:4-hydroxy-tetrahydrodipicolinate reductase
MSELGIGIVGAGGRMGRMLAKAVSEAEGARLVGGVERAGSELLGQDFGQLSGLGDLGLPLGDDPRALIEKADVLIDFTAPEATLATLKLSAEAGRGYVVGTTGFTAEQEAELAETARACTVVKAGNMSLGVNLLVTLVEQVARALDPAYDIEVVEMHHRHKVDAPSGTALMLGEAAAKGRGIDLAENSERGRDGITGAREPGAIGFASLRGGDVIGEHSVIFAGPGERVEITHKASDRMLFANGAVKAALWTKGKDPGLYSMLDVLGLAPR